MNEIELVELKDLLGLLFNPTHLKELKPVNYKYDELPKALRKLTELISLDLGGCDSLTTLPDSIDKLAQLTYLNIEWCRSLTTLPEPIYNLTQLNIIGELGSVDV